MGASADQENDKVSSHVSRGLVCIRIMSICSNRVKFGVPRPDQVEFAYQLDLGAPITFKATIIVITECVNARLVSRGRQGFGPRHCCILCCGHSQFRDFVNKSDTESLCRFCQYKRSCQK